MGMQIDCVPDETHNEMLCRGKIGKREGQVLVKVEKGGSMRVKGEKGDVEVTKKLKEHISNNTIIKDAQKQEIGKNKGSETFGEF